MALDLSPIHLSLPVQSGRQGPLDVALTHLGAAAFGRPGVPACHGMAVAAPDIDVLGADALPLGPDRIAQVADPVLEALGLRLIKVQAPCSDPEATALAALLLRAGLLGRILDLAHQHLKGRHSMGRKTLSHQLVKVGFADAYAAMRLAVETAALRTATADLEGLGDDHAALTRATLEAEKLMGGHGYLIGGTHPIGYLSMLLHTIYGPR